MSSFFLLKLIALLWKFCFQNKNTSKSTANWLLKFKFEESQCHPAFLNSLYCSAPGRTRTASISLSPFSSDKAQGSTQNPALYAASGVTQLPCQLPVRATRPLQPQHHGALMSVAPIHFKDKEEEYYLHTCNPKPNCNSINGGLIDCTLW